MKKMSDPDILISCCESVSWGFINGFLHSKSLDEDSGYDKKEKGVPVVQIRGYDFSNHRVLWKVIGYRDE